MADAKQCQWCGKETITYEAVDLIPERAVPQDFILKQLISCKGAPLKPLDPVCQEHELCFQLKYNSF